MFSFHKPKVYRSTSGCCICKAKSSSSRFTDSTKYEDDLIECFSLAERRRGEICNACVLLVKRFKKLPEGSNRNWRHVVDYRAGPGSKSLVRSKTRNKKRPKLKAEAEVRSASPGPDEDSDFTVLSNPNSPTEPCIKKPVKFVEVKKEEDDQDCGFVDLSIWKRKVTCCGVVFINGSVAMVDVLNWKPCRGNKKHEDPPPITLVASTEGVSPSCVLISDSSSDSGYDECSNPAPVPVVN